MSILFALCALWLTPNTLSESAIASLEQVLTTFLPPFCCSPWPFCFPASHRLSLGICSHLWSPSGCQALMSWYLFQVTLCIWAGMFMVHWEITLRESAPSSHPLTHSHHQYFSYTCRTQLSVFGLNLPCRFPCIYLWLFRLLMYTHFVSFHPLSLLDFVFRVLLSSFH